jgi:hypothetical protein
MEIIDNINRLLGDDLKQPIVPGAELKIAASCFSVYAFEALKTELDQIEPLEFIFARPTDETLAILSDGSTEVIGTICSN